MRYISTLVLLVYLWAIVDPSSATASTFHYPLPHYPRVNLDYATYEGIAGSSGVNEFLGMRYVSLDMLDGNSS